MELIAYIRLFRKWFWLLFLSAFLAGSAAFLQTGGTQLRMYRSSVTLHVGSALDNPNPTSNDLYTPARLVQTYIVLSRSLDVLEAAVEIGDLPVSPEVLGGSLSARGIEETSFIVLTVTSPDPVLAQEMVTAVANALIARNPDNLTPEEQEDVDWQKDEIDLLRQEVEQARIKLADIDEQIAVTTDADEIQQLREQRSAVSSQINDANRSISSYSAVITNRERSTSKLTIVEQARVQNVPIASTNRFTQTILGAMVGLALAVGIVLLIEYLDDTIRSPSEATQLLGLPVLAAITRFGKPRDGYGQRLITYRDPSALASEEYRTLRTNLLFSSNGNSGKNVFVVTSPGPSEGKSVTTANLAVTLATAGWRVLLVDADLRRPRAHDVFNLDNNVGLSTLLSVDLGDFVPNNGGQHRFQHNLDECIQETEIPGLRVITSGHIPLNPTEVLGSTSMQRWFQEFYAREDIDIVLFDTPPTLVVADSSVLASAIDVPVILVIEAKGTRQASALHAKERFDQLNINITGVVLNAVNPHDRGEYGYGGYYYYYYSDSSVKSSAKKSG